MRGRMPLGADNMGGNAAGVVDADYAAGVGQIGGSEYEPIAVENLPEHRHNLRSGETKQGQQFFAVTRTDSELQPDTSYFGLDPAQSATSGQSLPHSGYIDTDQETGQPLNIMNPTVTLNYIIYTGRA
jgi:microcystin-dependent protein